MPCYGCLKENGGLEAYSGCEALKFGTGTKLGMTTSIPQGLGLLDMMLPMKHTQA